MLTLAKLAKRRSSAPKTTDEKYDFAVVTTQLPDENKRSRKLLFNKAAQDLLKNYDKVIVASFEERWYIVPTIPTQTQFDTDEILPTEEVFNWYRFAKNGSISSNRLVEEISGNASKEYRLEEGQTEEGVTVYLLAEII